MTAELIDSLKRGAVEHADNIAEFVEGVAHLERLLTEIPVVEAEQFIRFLAVPDELTERFESEKPNLPSILWSCQIEILRSLGQRIAHEGDAESVPLWFDVYRELADRLAQTD